MINRIFFIAETFLQSEWEIPAEENIYFSILVKASQTEKIKDLYNSIENVSLRHFSLTLDIRELPDLEHLRLITSFLFMPSYLNIGHRRVINLAGESTELLTKTGSSISDYLSSQGIDNIITNNLIFSGNNNLSNGYRLFNSSESLTLYYKQLLQSDQGYNNDIFFLTPSADILKSTLLSLKQVEIEFDQNFPKLYSLLNQNMLLKKEISSLKQKNVYTETELIHQKQYIDVLRSDHSSKELQEYYNHEYEILPLWYKRFGHILKVIIGKRTFKSLFRDNVKKYKN